jgi:hypothetical protein
VSVTAPAQRVPVAAPAAAAPAQLVPAAAPAAAAAPPQVTNNNALSPNAAPVAASVETTTAAAKVPVKTAPVSLANLPPPPLPAATQTITRTASAAAPPAISVVPTASTASAVGKRLCELCQFEHGGTSSFLMFYFIRSNR